MQAVSKIARGLREELARMDQAGMGREAMERAISEALGLAQAEQARARATRDLAPWWAGASAYERLCPAPWALPKPAAPGAWAALRRLVSAGPAKAAAEPSHVFDRSPWGAQEMERAALALAWSRRHAEQASSAAVESMRAAVRLSDALVALDAVASQAGEGGWACPGMAAEALERAAEAAKPSTHGLRAVAGMGSLAQSICAAAARAERSLAALESLGGDSAEALSGAFSGAEPAQGRGGWSGLDHAVPRDRAAEDRQADSARHAKAFAAALREVSALWAKARSGAQGSLRGWDAASDAPSPEGASPDWGQAAARSA